MHATFKVMVLRRQEELVGPPQHDTIRIVWSHDSSDIFRAFEQLQWRFYQQVMPQKAFRKSAFLRVEIEAPHQEFQ